MIKGDHMIFSSVAYNRKFQRFFTVVKTSKDVKEYVASFLQQWKSKWKISATIILRKPTSMEKFKHENSQFYRAVKVEFSKGQLCF